MGSAGWWYCHPVSPFFADPPSLHLQLRARESAKTTISPRYPQETINAAPGNAQNSPDCAENNWTKWGNTLEKRQGGVTEKTRIYGPPWIAQTSDTIFNLQPISAY